MMYFCWRCRWRVRHARFEQACYRVTRKPSASGRFGVCQWVLAWNECPRKQAVEIRVAERHACRSQLSACEQSRVDMTIHIKFFNPDSTESLVWRNHWHDCEMLLPVVRTRWLDATRDWSIAPTYPLPARLHNRHSHFSLSCRWVSLPCPFPDDKLA